VILAGLDEAWIRDFLRLMIAAVLAFRAAHYGGRAFILRPISDMLTVTDRLRRGELSARVGSTLLVLSWSSLRAASTPWLRSLEVAVQHKDI
jgi:hypothetical protein